VVEAVRRMLPGLNVDPHSKHLAEQLWRAVTSAGANYEEARSAESRADFIHKVRVATKELREAHYWLRVVDQSTWLPERAAAGSIDEADQLVAILVASAKTARKFSGS
jgi:four helix bundle protein